MGSQNSGRYLIEGFHIVHLGKRRENNTLKRLFFALWPDPETRARCAAVSAALKTAGHPVPPDNLHVTLVFIGSVDEALEEKLIEAAETVNFAKISIRFDVLDYWHRPGIICLTGKPEDSAAASLVDALNQIAAALAIRTDDRPYQAHVTLLRKAKKLPPLAFEPIVWQADAFCLVESCSMPAGVVYRELKTWRALQTQENTGAETESDPGLTNPDGSIIIGNNDFTHRR
jgi:2'-5' RNA ligase